MSAPRRVLAIDDSLTIRKLLEMALGRAGYLLELASTGDEGLQRALRNPPDLVLLDYVLPDMKGIDVAGALMRDEKTAQVPVVLMSAKSDDLRPLFRELPSVVEFVGKPFTPSEITFLVADVLGRTGPARTAEGPASGADTPPPSTAPEALPALSFAQKEAVAKAMFGHLRERLARIPEWMRALGDAAPAPYFARKILTPELIEALLAVLAPVVREAPAAGPGEAAARNGAALHGQTSVLSLANLLRELAASGRSGVLELEHEERTTQLYLRRGQITLVTHDDPDEYVRQSTADLQAAPGPEMERARAEQRKTGKPVYASLTEAGRFPAAQLSDALYQEGKRALRAAIEAGPGGFEWREAKELPGYVEAFGRPYALEQIQLERLREVDDWAQVEVHVNSLDLVFRRPEGFSARLPYFELNETERRVLTLVNDRNSVRQVIERSGLTTFEAFHALFRLSQVGLIRKRATAAETPAAADGRPVAVLETDARGVREPLARLLSRRHRPVSLVAIEKPSDILELCLRERPRMVILNASAPGLDPLAAARELRATLEVSDVALVAVEDLEGARRPEELLAAGYDAVLTKPFLFADIERLLVA
jgi:two-component system phosphate regulon response regulator PhoB